MALAESDIEIWVSKGGFILAFDQIEGEESGTHVCTSEREPVTLILQRISLIRDHKASDAAERALKGTQP